MLRSEKHFEVKGTENFRNGGKSIANINISHSNVITQTALISTE